MNAEKCISIKVDTSELDGAIEKANRLLKILREVAIIINSLSAQKSEP